MKKILLIPVLIVLLLSGCHLWDTSKPEFADIRFNNIPPLGLGSVYEVMLWTADNIAYVADAGHYFQSPGETYTLMAGDCEDYTALAMYLLKVELGLDSVMINGYTATSGHAWVEVNGEWWEPQSASRCEIYIDVFPEIERWSYNRTMWRAVEVKRSVM